MKIPCPYYIESKNSEKSIALKAIIQDKCNLMLRMLRFTIGEASKKKCNLNMKQNIYYRTIFCTI